MEMNVAMIPKIMKAAAACRLAFTVRVEREDGGREEERGERRWREKVIYGQVSSRTTQFGVPRYVHHLVRKRLHNTCQSCTVMQLPNEASQFLWFDETLTAHSNIPN